MADLKCVYKAATLNAAETALDELENKWGERYPLVIKSWRSKWPTLLNYFKYPDYVRTPIYTTNAVEAVHRQFRKLTKTKGGFPNENSLLKSSTTGTSMKYLTQQMDNFLQTEWQMSDSQEYLNFG